MCPSSAAFPAGLSAAELLQLWESGAAQHPLDRALTSLAAAEPGAMREELARLPSGRRDERLLAVYERIFGGDLACQGCCPECSEVVEFTLNVHDLLAVSGDEDWRQPLVLAHADYSVTYRPPDSFDLAAIARLPDLTAARQRLLERCILQASCAGVSIALDQLPADVVGLVVEQMAAHDPLAVIELGLACPACGCQWQLLFDIVSFLWRKIEAHARRLLLEVHTLAQAYGWREADILALSPARRQAYLEMVI